MTYMAIFETEPKPRITVKPMNTRDGLRYQYYETGETMQEAKLRLADRLAKDGEKLREIAHMYHKASFFFDVEMVEDLEAGE